MLYEVRAKLFFEIEDEALDFQHDCERALAKSVVLNPDTPSVEYGTIERIENHHDADPNTPCHSLELISNEPDLDPVEPPD